VPDLTDIPNFCSHEHWGSIASIGSMPEGFRADVIAGAVPTRATTLTDLVVEPYLAGAMEANGIDVSAIDSVAPVEIPVQLCANGAYQATRRGILCAYGFDIDCGDAAAVAEVSGRIADRYASLFEWYERLMSEACFSELIRPVHPLYYVRQASEVTAEQEALLTRTVMRIDPFLEMCHCDSPHYALMVRASGVEPHDANSFRQLLDWFFDKAVVAGAVGIKQLQAYTRDLSFERHDDASVQFNGEDSADQRRVFQDWVVHECCKRADDLGWPHQVHVGTHNVPDSDPSPLEALASRYARQKLVLLHCWPFVNEAAGLAERWPNVFIDACWLVVLDPAYFRDATRCWLGHGLLKKITLGNDGTTIEMAVGSSLIAREILGKVLTERSQGADLLHNNAVDLYGIGRPIEA